MTTGTTARAGGGTAAAILGVAAAGWAVAIWRMHGMDMGVATALGPFGEFIVLWVAMMAAMMLPGAVPAALRVSHRRTAGFLGAYLAVWVPIGIVVYALDRPHGTFVAGAVVLAAGVFELTPVKREFRCRCRERVDSGVRFGTYCVGSSIGLMAMMAALGPMSVTWMAIVAAFVLGQKLVGARAIVDVPLAVAIVALGALVIVDPSLVLN